MKKIAICSGVLALGLLVVGVESGTIIRHLVQMVPVLAVLGLALRNRPEAKDASLAVFLFWFGIMALIWLFLLGVSRIVTGTFTPIEIAMTILMGGACLAGAYFAVTGESGRRWLARISAFAFAFALQFAFMWVSFLEPLAHD